MTKRTLEAAVVLAKLVLFDVAMKSLNQIATTPRNRGARRYARATVAFIETQIAARAALSSHSSHARGKKL